MSKIDPSSNSLCGFRVVPFNEGLLFRCKDPTSRGKITTFIPESADEFVPVGRVSSVDGQKEAEATGAANLRTVLSLVTEKKRYGEIMMSLCALCRSIETLQICIKCFF